MCAAMLYYVCSTKALPYRLRTAKVLSLLSGVTTFLGGIVCLAQLFGRHAGSILLCGGFAAALLVPLLLYLPQKSLLSCLSESAEVCSDCEKAAELCVAYIQTLDEVRRDVMGAETKALLLGRLVDVRKACVPGDTNAAEDKELVVAKLVNWTGRTIRQAVARFPDSVRLRQLEVVFHMDCSADQLLVWAALCEIKGRNPDFAEGLQMQFYKYSSSFILGD